MLVGLTGGIGSGKTIIAKVFEAMGCIIYNSDDRAKQMYFLPKVKQQVIKLLGTLAYKSDTEINNTYIAKEIFNNTSLLHQLNNIIHPAVKEDFINFQKQCPPNTIIIKETALLFEANIYRDLPFNILVTAPTETKIKRVMSRNNVSSEFVLERMKTQWDDNQKIPLADFIIDNSGEIAVIPQIEKCLQKIAQHVKA